MRRWHFQPTQPTEEANPPTFSMRRITFQPSQPSESQPLQFPRLSEQFAFPASRVIAPLFENFARPSPLLLTVPKDISQLPAEESAHPPQLTTRVQTRIHLPSARRAPKTVIQVQPNLQLAILPPSGVVKKTRKLRGGSSLLPSIFRPQVPAPDRLRFWFSPHSSQTELALRSSLSEDLADKAYALVFASLAPASMSNYAAGLRRFHEFCDEKSISENDRMPASAPLLTAFIAEHAGKVQGGTIKSWMSGLKAWHDFHRATWNGDERWVELARRSANKMGSKSKNAPRSPVTIEHMVALRAAVNLSSPFDASVWAIASAAFWGCRRLGELTIPSSNAFDPNFHIARDARVTRVRPTSSTPGTSIHIPWTKSTREKGGTLVLTDRDDDLCPEKARLNHLSVNPNIPDDAPMFAFNVGADSWAPMTKPSFMARCNDIWKKAKLLAVTGHSFRIGGSTELLLAGVACEVVAATGGWTSLAFLLYWRKLEHIIPSNIGKAYDKNKLAEVAAAFERFRIDNNITIIEELDDL